MFPDPWARLACDWPDVEVRYEDLGRRWEVTRWYADRPPMIALHKDLYQVEARAALTHGIEHLEFGAPCETLRASIERRVIDATARWLLPDVDQIAVAMATYESTHLAAHDLWVPHFVLIDRIKCFTEEEWLVIEKRGAA